MTTAVINGSSQKIPFKEKVFFAMGDAASNFFWMPFILYGTYFYTVVCRIDPLIVGGIMAFARFFDALIDPIIGIISDRTKRVEGVGQYRPYLRKFFIPFGIIGAACFYTPVASMNLVIIYAATSYFLFGVAYSIINVPYSGVMSVMSGDEKERAVLSQYRMIGAQTGGFVLSLVVPLLVGYFAGASETSKGDERTGYFYTFCLVGMSAVVLWFLCYKNTRERVIPEPKRKGNIASDMKLVLFSIPIILLFVITTLANTAYTVRFANAMFFFEYFTDAKAIQAWGGPGMVTGYFFTCGTIFAILGNLIFVKLTKKWDKKTAFIILMFAGGIVSMSFQFIPSDQILLLLAAQAFFSIFTGPTGGFLWSMGTDVAAFIKQDKGQDVQGLVMSITSFTQKSGWVIGGIVAPVILGLTGYQVDAAEQNKNALGAMQYMMSYIPGAMLLLSGLLMLVYPLSRARMRKLGMTS